MTRMLRPSRLLPAAGFSLLCLVLALGYAIAQSTPAAPAIGSVTSGDTTLAVAWTAPAGETGIAAYDVRHIKTIDDETMDANWAVVDDAWTSGALQYTITGLTNGTEYDVQVRAVNFNGDGTWSDTKTGTPALPVSTIDSLRADDRAVLVSWSAPTGITTGVAAYDVRYIETSADETMNSNWTVEEDAWEDGDGSLSYAVTGLTNGTEYDVQVRAVDVDDVDGAWSATTSATPADHGNTRAGATSVTVDARVWGAIDPIDDEDYFTFSVSSTADYWIYTLGDLDTVGELLDSGGMSIDINDRGSVLPNPDNFFLWRKLQSGTYYIKVTGYGPTNEPYILRVREFTDTTSRSNAATLNLNGFASGTIDPEDDQDYFKLELSEATEVAIRASGFPDTVGELQRSNGTVIASNDDGYLPGGRRNFLIRENLAAGVYYVKVSSFAESSDGPYSVYAAAITEPGSAIADAQPLTLGGTAGGIIDPAGDEDYFSLTLEETTYVNIGGVSQVINISGALTDENDLQAPVDSFHFDDTFSFQGRLDAGTYYLKVTGKDATDTGRYTVRAVVEGSYTYFANRCSGISRSTGINDPLYGCQWHLKNNDQFRNGAGQDIRVEEVWPTYTGSGINVAVVDDGMHYRHEDLTDNVLTSFNHNYDPDLTDIYHPFEDHGTAVAGLIAAKDNSLGMRGVAPDAKIYGYNYLVEQTDANEANAMSRNAATTAISNNSWGPGDSGQPEPATELWEAAVEDGVTNGYGGKGVFYAWAAGNGGDDDDYSTLDEYSNFYAVTAVCAVGHDDKRSEYSEAGANLWVCGPSSSGRVGQPRIATTDNGHRYRGSFGGTSAATPIVSGVVALIREANTALTWRDVKLILAASARKNDPDNTGWEEGAFKYGSTTDRYNFNHEYGFGMVDAKAAVDLAPGWTNVRDLREITSESSVINLRIPDLPSSGTPTTVTASLTVEPYVEFVEFVEVNAHFNHSSFRDLTVELVSPSGAVSTLATSAPIYGALTTEFRFGSARHLGEDAAGEWTLRIKDGLRRDSGILRSWGLTIYGHGSISGAPDIDTVTPGGGTLTIGWKAPADTGETAITSYDLRYIRDDATDRSDDNWSVVTGVGTPSNRSHTITGLEGGVKYEFQLRAHNDSGHGPWSQAEAEEPTTVAASALSITSITRGDRSLAVVWTAPADTGGGVITAYDVRYIETSEDEKVESNWTVRDNAWRSGDLRYVISNLTNTTEYDVQVRAVNSAGDGAWSGSETGTPLPDDIPITLQWEETSLEVAEDAGSVVLTAVFTTTLDSPPEADFTFDVSLTTTDSGTTQGDDYTTPASSATFVASDFSQTDVNGQQRYRATRDFTVAIIDDTADESDEAFRVRLAYAIPGLSHLQGGPSTAVVTIKDNEHVPVTISWEQPDVTVRENAGSGTLRAYAVTTEDKRPEAGFAFDVSIYTSNGSATQPADYTQVDATVTFSRNDFSRVTVNGERRYRAAKQVQVPIQDDTSDEDEEDFTVTIEYANPGPPHLQGGPAVMSVKITDNDFVPVTISWEQTFVSVDEYARTVTLQARATTTSDRMPESGFNVALSATTADGTATQGSDYRRLNSSFSFRQGDFTRTDTGGGQFRYQASRNISVTIIDDTVDEPHEDFTLTLAYRGTVQPHWTGGSDTATVTITDVNAPPTITTTSSSATGLRQTENRTSRLYTYRATDPEGRSITWSVVGTDGRFFTIDERGQFSFSETSPPNFEIPGDAGGDNVYNVTVRAQDDQFNSATLDVTVTVTDVNEGPEVTGRNSYTVEENQELSGASFFATDPEGDSVTRWSLSGTDGGDFSISETGVLTFRNIPDYERPADSNQDNEYLVMVRAYDNRNAYDFLDITITVTPVNEPPTITTTSSSATGLRQTENRTSRLYTYRATDPEGSSIDWSVEGQDGRFFTIDQRGEFSFSANNPPDYEQPEDSGGDNIYDVTVRAQDEGLNTATLDVTVTVTPVNEPPTVIGLDTRTIDENDENFSESYSASDPEGASTTFTWSLSGTDRGDFNISQDGELTFRNTPNYESPADSNRNNEYLVTVRASDGQYTGMLNVVVTVWDANEAPEFTSSSKSRTSFTYPENSTHALYTYRAADPERGTITWSASGTDGDDFNISESGALSFADVPDFEEPVDANGDNEYLVTVEARDRGFNFARLEVTVNVTNSTGTEEPTITTTSRPALSFQENGTGAVYTYSANDPQRGIIAWSVRGTDVHALTITSDGRGRGVLTFTGPPDFENPADSNGDNVYEITVVARDEQGLTDSFDVTVTVTNHAESVEPTISTRRPPTTYRENRTSTVYNFRASDPQRGQIDWSRTGTDASAFALSDSGGLSFASPPDFESPGDSDRQNDYELTVVATDEDGHSDRLAFIITVTDVNEGPEITRVGSAPGSVAENHGQTQVLARYTAIDPENPSAQISRWNTSGRDGGDFVMNEQGELRFRYSPDYERPADSNRDNIYEVTVRAYDGRYYGTFEETVRVTPVNEAPTITTTSRTTFTQPENRISTLYTYRATDPEGGTVTWSAVGPDGGDFTIVGGALRFGTEPDFESPAGANGNGYQVTVRAEDAQGNPDTLEVTVTVTAVDEGPEVTSGGNSFTVRENQEWTGASFRASDPEGGTVSRWSLAGRDGGDFAISETGLMTFRNIPDYERPADSNRDNIYEVTVRPYDGRNYGSHDVTVTVTPVNEPPSITTTSRTSFTQPENRISTLYTYRATDPEGGTVTWSAVGPDGGDFTIVGGALRFGTEPDFESPAGANGNGYRVTVRAEDAQGNPDTLEVTVTVTAVDEGPEVTSGGSSFTVQESQEWTGAIFTASDPEGGTVSRWGLAGRDGGDFAISETGLMTFRNIPDYERPADSNRDNIYEVTVRPYDGRNYGSHDVTVTVTPVNEPPSITTTSRTTFTQPENRISTLYTYRATDPEGGDFEWDVVGPDAGVFSISETGVLTFSSPPDFESPTGANGNEYQVTVQAKDAQGNPDTLEVTVTVTDVNEGPEIRRLGNEPGSVPENQDQMQVLAKYTATDPEDTSAQITRWSPSGTDGGDFVISEQGELRFRNSPDHERPADSNRDNIYEVTVRASDGRYYGTFAETEMVRVTNVNEAPVITTKSRTGFTQRENATSALHTYRATDPDRDDAITWSVEGTDRDDFAIYDGILTFRLLPDHEIPADLNGDNEYGITVVASDSGNLRDTVDATITITEVNEGPEVSGRQAHTVVEGQELSGASFTAADPEGDAITRWSLSGSDGGDFEISETGVLTLRNVPDYDRPADSNRDNEYLVSIRAYDAGNRYGSLDVTVNVTDVNEEAPVVTGSGNRTVSENTASAIHTYRATDADRDDTITWSTSGADGHLFEMSEQGALSFREAPDYENPRDSDRNNEYQLEVVATDSEGLTGELMVTITVTEVNEGPEITGTPTYAIQEFHQNLVNATYSATDPEEDPVTSWRLSGSDGGDFTITDTSELTGRNTADLSFRYPPDVDRPADSNRDNEYLVAIRAYDNRGRYGSYDVTVTVTAANEPPVITGSDARTIRENGTGTIHTYRATDPEGDDFSWIPPGGTDGHLFDISDRGALTFRNPPDFDIEGDADRDNDYQVTVQARDNLGNTGTFDVTVTVTDVNEGPEVSGRETMTVQEYTDPTQDPALQTLATYSARDPEGSDISRWSLSGRDGGDFSINENGELTFRYAPDYDRPVDSNRDNEYLVSVRAYDVTNRYGSLDATVTVRGENEADPVVTGSQSLSFRENTAVATRLYTYRATDADRGTIIVWSVRGRAGNNDGNGFGISETGVLTFKEMPDYELPADSDRDNEYLVTVVATDDQGREGTLDVAVTVTEVPEGPEITSPSGQTEFTHDENVDRVVATFTARDPEEPASGIARWSLAGSDAGDLTITDTSQQTGRNTAELTFRNTPDYDSPADSNRDNEYLVTIRAYDQGNRYGSLDVKIAVIDENEHAPVVTGSQTLSFRENTTTTTRLYRYQARDVDRGAVIAWSLEGDDRDDFAIDEGALTFNEEPDYEDPADDNEDNEYEITVVASDGTYRGTLDVTIMVTGVNEGPEITGPTTRTVAENFEDMVGTYTGEDPEDTTADITRWSVTGRDGGDFTINEDGELTFRNPPDFERPADSNRDNQYEVTVRASDGRYYGTYDVNVTVEAVNEAPEFRSGSRTSFTHRENGTSALYTYRATDPEGDDFTWEVGGTDGGDFEISEDGGVLTFKTPPDFENPGDLDDDNEYLLTVVVRDDQSSMSELEVLVAVTDLNEGPEIQETSTNADITVSENSEGVLFDYSATDPEDPDAEITRWSVTGTDGGDFTINEDGELSLRNVPDFERPADSNRDNEYLVTVRASDGRYYGTLEVTVKVEAVNEEPEFRSGSTATFAYQENGTSDLYTYRATDPEGNDVAWDLSGTDRGVFEISETGVLSFIDPPDYESPTDSGSNNVYEVTVEAGDGDGETARLEVTVTVTNLTDALPIITGRAQVGRTLRADISGIGDADGRTSVPYSYQWIRNEGETDIDIDGETDSTYTPSGIDVGKTLKVRVSFADDAKNQEALTSAATAAVAATVPTEPLSLTVTRGSQTQELDASWQPPASNGGSAITGYKVQWKESAHSWDTAADVSEATVTGTTHTITGLTGGVKYTVRVIASNDAGDGPASAEATGRPAGGESEQQPSQPENTEPTGRPAISGTAQVGETVTADTSGIADEDGLDDVSYSYQWIAGGLDIDGATGSSHTLTSTQQGQTIQVRVIFTDDANNAETLTSEATAAVAAADNRPPTGLPTISGTAQVGQTLTADTTGIADADRLDNASYSYQWVRNDGSADADIQDATGPTYTLSDDDHGKTIKVRVSFTDDSSDASNEETLTSAATATVAAAANSPATGAPAISGTAHVEETLTADTSGIGDADGLDDAVFAYQWIRNDGSADADIQDATDSTYTLSADDLGKTLKVRVNFTDDASNEESLTSAASATVAAAAAAAATVPGEPGHLRVFPHDAQGLDLSWEAPASDGGSPITGYKVQWKEAADSWDTPADVSEETVTGTTHTINGLTDGAEYTVRVLASNEVGDGDPSDEETGTPRETTPPELSTAAVDGAALTLTYNEALDGGSTPATSAFAVTMGGAARTVNAIAVSGSTVTLTLASAVEAGDTVTVDYTVPTGESANKLQDTSGNTAASFSGQTVTNSTSSGQGTGRTSQEEAANSPATGRPGITGAVRAGETLTATTDGIADEDGLTDANFAYQWVRHDLATNTDTDIAGARGSTYTVTDEDEAVKVRVSFSDDAGNDESLTSYARLYAPPLVIPDEEETQQQAANTPATGEPGIDGSPGVGRTLTATTSDIEDEDGLSGRSTPTSGSAMTRPAKPMRTSRRPWAPPTP